MLLEKTGGQHWNYNGGFKWVSPELELNDIGFLRSADEMIQYFNLRYRTGKPVGISRNISLSFNQFTAFDFEGNYNRIQYEAKGDMLVSLTIGGLNLERLTNLVFTQTVF